ncbi:MAG: class I SAM-dependent methyltransferase [Candidatus Sericytochromatia bacterium]|nr:class I SAM-dependent methyltransferase [Candidatus Sericytochromatia bacterium]
MMTDNAAEPTRVEAAPLPIVDWDRYADEYDNMAAVNNAYQDLVVFVTGTALAANLPDAARVMEIGAGTGNFCLSLAEQRPDLAIHAVDLNPTMLAHLMAKAHHRAMAVTAQQFDLTTPWPWQAHWDMILAVHAVMHLPDPHRALEQAFSALRPGGCLLIADIARALDVDDWQQAVAADIVAAHMAETGSISAAQAAAEAFFAENAHVLAVNRAFAAHYATRPMSRLVLADLCQTLVEIGFVIEAASDGHYRDYDNVILARRMAP